VGCAAVSAVAVADDRLSEDDQRGRSSIRWLSSLRCPIKRRGRAGSDCRRAAESGDDQGDDAELRPLIASGRLSAMSPRRLRASALALLAGCGEHRMDKLTPGKYGAGMLAGEACR
jgi:hypothetical protein